MEVDLSKYRHTATWFYHSEIRKQLPKFIGALDEKRAILEIGSFEGLSACCFSDNLLDHPDSTLDCVDPFDIADTTTPLTSETEVMCRENVAKSRNASKVAIHKVYSRDFFASSVEPKYDIIYIDGSHVLEDVILDMTECFVRLLKAGGIMWMDDYGGGIPGLRSTMDNLIAGPVFAGKCDVIHRGYQLAVRKK